ncbi:MAG: hypothetical protein BRC45_02875 [Cyanobacteria bacterium QS_5_48_63]|nr:MAG: hypothetical protein BRC45_02875 [Cyanobacteria bacterium QS_5_48_63]
MAPENHQDWSRRLQELEKEINQASSPVNNTEPGQPLQRHNNTSQSIKSTFNQVRDWFNGIPKLGKLAVVAIGVVVGFSLLRTVLQLVSSLFTLAIVGVALYFVYKLFIASNYSQ